MGYTRLKGLLQHLYTSFARQGLNQFRTCFNTPFTLFEHFETQSPFKVLFARYRRKDETDPVTCKTDFLKSAVQPITTSNIHQSQTKLQFFVIVPFVRFLKLIILLLYSAFPTLCSWPRAETSEIEIIL